MVISTSAGASGVEVKALRAVGEVARSRPEGFRLRNTLCRIIVDELRSTERKEGRQVKQTNEGGEDGGDLKSLQWSGTNGILAIQIIILLLIDHISVHGWSLASCQCVS